MTRRNSSLIVISKEELESLKGVNNNTLYTWDIEPLMDEGVMRSIIKVLNKIQLEMKLKLWSWAYRWNESEIYDWVAGIEIAKKEFWSLEELLQNATAELNKKRLEAEKKKAEEQKKKSLEKEKK